jgi:hypothetical protein
MAIPNGFCIGAGARRRRAARRPIWGRLGRRRNLNRSGPVNSPIQLLSTLPRLFQTSTNWRDFKEAGRSSVTVSTASGVSARAANVQGLAIPRQSFARRRQSGARRERPRRRRTTEQRGELVPPLHSITSSARPIRGSGIVRPSAFAVLRLMISSTFVACWTGRSAGFSPLTTRPV